MMNIKKENYSLAISLWKEWNSKINVISRKDADAIFEHHILHSLSIAEYIRRHYGTLEAAAGRNGNADAASISGTATTSLTGKVLHLKTEVRLSLRTEVRFWRQFPATIFCLLLKASTFRPVTILDLGTGGAFRIPLAMEWPERSLPFAIQ